MTIRKATSQDVSAIRDLVLSLAHVYLNPQTTASPDWFAMTLTDNEFISRINCDDYLNFVYESAGDVAGYISVKKSGYLYHLFVAQPHQGKGIARKLWQHTSGQCQARVYKLRSSLHAVPVYEKFGFKVSGVAEIKDGIEYQPMELIL